MTPDVNETQLREIHELLARGEKIAAIKAWREATGLGLAESKAAVEAEHARLAKDQPEKYQAAKGGCLGLLLLPLGAAVAWQCLR